MGRAGGVGRRSRDRIHGWQGRRTLASRASLGRQSAELLVTALSPVAPRHLALAAAGSGSIAGAQLAGRPSLEEQWLLLGQAHRHRRDLAARQHGARQPACRFHRVDSGAGLRMLQDTWRDTSRERQRRPLHCACFARSSTAWAGRARRCRQAGGRPETRPSPGLPRHPAACQSIKQPLQAACFTAAADTSLLPPTHHLFQGAFLHAGGRSGQAGLSHSRHMAASTCATVQVHE